MALVDPDRNTEGLREKIDALNEQAWALKDQDPERSRDLCDQVQRLALTVSYEEGLASSRLLLSILEWDHSNYQDALSLAFEAETLFKKNGNLRRQASALSHLAGIHFFLGEYSRALDLGLAAIQLSEECGDRGLQADLLNDTGYFFAHMGRFSEAVLQLLRSLEIHRQLGSKQGEANVLDSLGKTYYLMGDYPLALSYESQSLETAQAVGYKRAQTEALSNLGKIYAASSDPAQALAYFEQALALAQEREYKQFEAAILLDMGKIYAAEHKTEQAQQCLSTALKIAEGIHSKPVMFEIHQALSNVYEQSGRLPDALAHYKQFHEIKEVIFNEKTSTMLSSKQAILEVQKQLEDLVKERTQQVEREKRYFEVLVLNSPVAIVVMDLNTHIVSWNPEAEKLFGYTQEEAIGRNVDHLLTSELQRSEASTYSKETLEENRLIRSVTQRTRKDGTIVDVEVLGAPIVVDGQRVGALAIYHDITELQRARQTAEEATRAKSAFLAAMSHEIRTPMNGVIGMTSLLLDTSLTDEQRDYAETIRNSADALLTVINDILDFSKIEAGRLELEEQPFDLRECVESALDLVAAQASEKSLDLAYLFDQRVPGMVVGDVTRLRQILLNLLSNACKFTTQGEVVVRVQPAETTVPLPASASTPLEWTMIHFSVEDTGIGIPPERMDRLFQSFSQVDASTTRKYGGTGLGLAISKRLAGLMGGTLWVESEADKGSTFHFTVQAEVAPLSTTRAQLRSNQPHLVQRRVLIVDDNLTNRRILVMQAQAWGMLPRDTASPSEALEWIRRGDPFDVALLDMQMPEMDGVTLAAEIRRYRDIETLPLVMLTSLGRREAGTTAAEFAAYLIKPIKQSQLYDTLAKIFDEHPAAYEQTLAPGRQFVAPLAHGLPLRILVAEDHPVNQKLALQILKKMGYRADVAGNGHEVLQALERQPYDVVLMDVQMPEMDGLEATRRICQQWPRDRRPRIIAMTANAMQGDREECLAVGMDDYLSKPMQIHDLKAALERAGQRMAFPGESPSGPGPVDWAVLEGLRSLQEAGEPDFVQEMIGLYLTETPLLLAALREAILQGDTNRLKQTAHTLKGNSKSLGAPQVARLSLDLEQMGRSQSIDGAETVLAELEREFERTRQALAAKR